MSDLENMNNNENKKKDSNPRKKIVYRAIIVVLSIVLVCSLGLMVHNWWVKKEAENRFDKLAEQTNNAEGQEEEDTTKAEEEDILTQRGIQIPTKNIDWDALQEENEHIYAWIYIPDTNIDYPILQHPEDDVYYLERNLDGTKGYPGCIYSEHVYNGTDFMDFHTLLYGHNMKDGSMFQNLHNFKDETYFEEHPYIYVYTPETVYVYEIFAAYTHNDEHLLICYDTETEAGKQEYLNMVAGLNNSYAHFRDIEITTENHILTLSTCENNAPENRYLVQGVLINDPTLESSSGN